jgi:hypothetical protein
LDCITGRFSLSNWGFLKSANVCHSWASWQYAWLILFECPGGNCRHDATIVKLDPVTMMTRVVARLPANATFSDGTTALQVGDTIFLGSYRGDAVAYMRAPD